MALQDGRRQGRYWMLTIPGERERPEVVESVAYLKGQQEIGHGGYHHWQILAIFTRKVIYIFIC